MNQIYSRDWNRKWNPSKGARFVERRGSREPSKGARFARPTWNGGGQGEPLGSPPLGFPKNKYICNYTIHTSKSICIVF